MFDNNTLVLINKFVLVGTLKRLFKVWSKTGFCLMNHHETLLKQKIKPRNKCTMYVWLM